MTDYCGPLSALSLNESIQANGHWASNPAHYAAIQLTALLRKSGIPVSRPAGIGVAPASAKLSYVERSAPLSRILAAMNKPSDNFFAEMLTKGLGASFGGGGTTAAGVKVERAFLISLGISGTTFRLTDGSGLSYYDRLTALDITALLAAMSKRSDWPVFWNSLSVAGVDGTLADRMRGTAAQKNLHGKTGTLTVASNLSGYVTSRNGAVARLLAAHEQAGLDQPERGARRPGRDRRRPGPLKAGRRGRLDAQPGAQPELTGTPRSI